MTNHGRKFTIGSPDCTTHGQRSCNEGPPSLLGKRDSCEPTLSKKAFSVQCFCATDVPTDLRDFALNLTEAHMRSLYDEAASHSKQRSRISSGPDTKIGTWNRWSTAAKRRELFAKSSSFVFVFSRAESPEGKALPLSRPTTQRPYGFEMNSSELMQNQVRARSSEPELVENLIPSRPPNQYIADGAPERRTPVAFACYRIVRENVPLGSSGIRPIYKQISLLYLYELHCTRSWRNKGIGTLLLQMVENTAASAGAAGVALTCLKNNRESLGWYKHRGYERAPHCPDAEGKSAYQILWKPFKPSSSL